MTDANSTRRYLALWFPFLSAERLRQQAVEAGDALPDEPLVLVARSGNAMRLAAVDAGARGLGLAPGQALADARAALPHLLAVAHDAAADARWLARLGRECRAWTPMTALVAPDALVLDIAGCAHLFGGEAALRDAVVDRMRARGMSLRAALAGTAPAAVALARFGGEQVAALPVAALGLDAEATTALRRAGLATIGDLSTRPLAGLAARFGAGAVRGLRELLGDAAAPIVPLAAPARLRCERRFPEPLARQEAVAAVLLDLLREAAGLLTMREQGGRRFALTLCRSDGARRRLAVETGAPTRDPALVLRLFDERIATLADPLDPGFGYDAILLAVPVTEPLAPLQEELGGGGAAQAALAELVDRLSTRLGAGAVRRLEPRASHIPEQAQLALPAIACPAPARWPPPVPGEPPLRPLFLFDPPQPVDVLAEVPDGPPHRFRWRRRLHEVRLYEGPERIAAEWWRRAAGEEPGKGGLTRDYYRVEDARGRRFWLFRHGLHVERPQPRWYLHGLFA